jgi:hypothetical protein
VGEVPKVEMRESQAILSLLALVPVSRRERLLSSSLAAVVSSGPGRQPLSPQRARGVENEGAWQWQAPSVIRMEAAFYRTRWNVARMVAAFYRPGLRSFAPGVANLCDA